MSARRQVIYRFLDWRVYPAGNRLWCADRDVQLTPKAMDVLCRLLEGSGRVVSKRELLDDLWSGRPVTDDALTVTVYELRKARGDRARQPTFIQTVVRRGYRFLPEVTVETPEPGSLGAGGAPSPAASTAANPSVPSGPASRSFRWRAPGRPLAASLLAAGLLAGVLVTGGSVAASRALAPRVETSTLQETWAEALLEASRRDLDRRTAESLTAAERRYLEVERSRPDDVRAQAGLARVAAMRADLRLGDRFELYFEARMRAEQALAAAPDEVDALLALSSAQRLLEWDPQAAGRSLDAALAADPGHPDVHQIRSWWLSAEGQHGEAVAAARRALELAPRSLTKRADLAFILVMAGHFDDGAAEARAVLDEDPGTGAAWGALIRARLGVGDLDGALRLHLEMLAAYGATPEALEPWRALGREEGYWAFAGDLLDATAPDDALVHRAAAFAQLGESDRALALLERAAERRDWEVLWLEALPELAPLHAEERFQALLALPGVG
ncbi:MAG: winged helix-turn-helix domain-containing protein [Acidobacteriota bacterium]